MNKWILWLQILFLALFFVLLFAGKPMLWLLLFVISFGGAFFFGRFYCGVICPMNTLMRPVSWLGKKPGLKTNRVPAWLKSKWLSWSVLLFLAVVMILSRTVLMKDLPMLLVLLVVSVLFALRYEEWVFHNHVCPFGTLLRISGKNPVRSTRVEEDRCVACKKCEVVCPSAAIVVDKQRNTAEIDYSICLQCAKCITVCPVSALSYGKVQR